MSLSNLSKSDDPRTEVCDKIGEIPTGRSEDLKKQQQNACVSPVVFISLRETNGHKFATVMPTTTPVVSNSDVMHTTPLLEDRGGSVTPGRSHDGDVPTGTSVLEDRARSATTFTVPKRQTVNNLHPYDIASTIGRFKSLKSITTSVVSNGRKKFKYIVLTMIFVVLLQIGVQYINKVADLGLKQSEVSENLAKIFMNVVSLVRKNDAGGDYFNFSTDNNNYSEMVLNFKNSNYFCTNLPVVAEWCNAEQQQKKNKTLPVFNPSNYDKNRGVYIN